MDISLLWGLIVILVSLVYYFMTKYVCGLCANLCLLVTAGLFLLMIHLNPDTEELEGGGREAIFSRFNYQPDFPLMSQLDTVDLDRFSKVYNEAGPLKFYVGRPYRFYQTKGTNGIMSGTSTWLYPWDFPRQIDQPCLQTASHKCNEPIMTVNSEDDKLSGLGAQTPKDLVYASPCFNRVYKECQDARKKDTRITVFEQKLPSSHSV